MMSLYNMATGISFPSVVTSSKISPTRAFQSFAEYGQLRKKGVGRSPVQLDTVHSQSRASIGQRETLVVTSSKISPTRAFQSFAEYGQLRKKGVGRSPVQLDTVHSQSRASIGQRETLG
ncbi:hypothetical protein DY000_02034719 [Brassica cretica]|uniref:DUF4005 domain-containing protein n=1 Tax=Brassica cretica TaxID=69181 RepID=A0ABQ7DXK6_BRACR|nr:hypothetical protein DY000_02034719 [Brassica cretica]